MNDLKDTVLATDGPSGGCRACFLVLALCAGVLLLYPRCGSEAWFDPGDRGRDVYAFERALQGDRAYRDYVWFYGPLMPYVYGGFIAVTGCQISNMVLCKLGLTLLAAAFLFLAVSELAAPITAFLACAWFLIFFPDFFFTYNHIGGIAMILTVAWTTLAYARTSRLAYAYGGLLGCFLLALIKINFAVIATAVCVLGVFLTDRVRKVPQPAGRTGFYLTAMGAVPLLTAAIYVWLLRGLALMEIRQCLPYWSDDEPRVVNPFAALLQLGQHLLTRAGADEANLCVTVILLFAVVRTVWLLITRRLEQDRRKVLIVALLLLGVFCIANLHEYLRSAVGYRRYWSLPPAMVLGFVLADVALRDLSRTVRLCVGLVAVLVMGLAYGEDLHYIEARKAPGHFLSHPRARIHVGNSREWVRTVEEVTAYLEKTLKPGELFFALPYDALYYYLTGRRSPSRQLIFFAHTKIPPWQEQSILRELEHNQVNCILLANIYKQEEAQFGVFGQTYCPVIARYIEANFTPVAKFGNWTDEPGSYVNHGVVILKRKQPSVEGGASQIGEVGSVPATPFALSLPGGQ